jgi:hypothetical protein
LESDCLARTASQAATRLVGLVLALYVFLALLFSVISVMQSLENPGRRGATIGIFTNGLQVTVGMLLISIGAVTALAEERVRGSFDTILTTPLSTLAIVWGKWWGSYRGVFPLVILPTVLAAVLGLHDNAWDCSLLLAGLMLAHGAFLTSLGLAIAVGVARFGRAVTIVVVLYVVQTFGFIVLLAIIEASRKEDGLLWLSYGSPGLSAMIFSILTIDKPREFNYVLWAYIWIAMLWAAAAFIFLMTVLRFNSFMGRASRLSLEPVLRVLTKTKEPATVVGERCP